MKDKTILITGSTDGIGKQTALDLAKMGATVLLHGRNPGRADTVLKEIRKSTGNDNIEVFIADLASLTQVRHLAEQVRQRHGRLDVLINNAGVYETRHRVSKDGFEMTLAVNHLAPFFLTLLLLDLIIKSSPGRIINVSSQVHASGIDFDNLQAEKYYSAYEAYSLSKLCNVLFTYELAERLKQTGVTVNCLHPGVIDTKLLKAGWGMGGSPVTQGAKTSVYLAAAPELSTVTGKYFKNMKPEKSSGISYDVETRKRLWRISERLCHA
ncbi:MAG: SDR family oxidoreductase [Deltaproteobacteria bacterium]|nr:SDR family oxidoreductase [Deltaproteobacteria bacterium]MBW2118041.1 SDR family oxidoreductase [Deltaproteobacteria bacterium]MBW2343221.1 SDR family oxidoreductase [Deltaproteobacteria bacterium]